MYEIKVSFKKIIIIFITLIQNNAYQKILMSQYLVLVIFKVATINYDNKCK